MNKSDIGLNAGKIWRLLSNYAKWDYGTLKRKSGLKDKELGAALGWLACEDKIVLHQEDGELYIFFGRECLYRVRTKKPIENLNESVDCKIHASFFLLTNYFVPLHIF